MNIYRMSLTFFTAIALIVSLACGSQPAPSEAPVNAEPTIIEWSIGPKGGLGSAGAFITQHSWEPKKLDVPLNHPFIVRFVPRDDTTDTIVFGNTLKKEVGTDLVNLVVEGGQPADTPVMVIRSANSTFDVFSREHRGVGGFGTLVTPES